MGKVQTKTYALEPGAKKRLEARWTAGYASVTFLWDGKAVDEIARADLEDGADIELPDGTLLDVDLDAVGPFGMAERLSIRHKDGKLLPQDDGNKIVLIVGSAVLVILVIGVVWSYLGVRSTTRDLVQVAKVMKSNRITEARVMLMESISDMQLSCISDPSGARNAARFDPHVAHEYVGVSCKLTEHTSDLLTDPQQAKIQLLADTDDKAKATALSLDPSACVRFVSGAKKVIGCFESPANQDFRIIDMENVVGAQ